MVNPAVLACSIFNSRFLKTQFEKGILIYYIFCVVYVCKYKGIVFSNSISNCVNWHINNTLVRPSKMTFGSTKGKILCSNIKLKVIWANQKTDSFCIAGYANMQCLTLHAFLHLLKHRTSFQAFCRYVNCKERSVSQCVFWGLGAELS